MRITDEIIAALNNGIDAVGSKSEFAHKAGVQVQTIGKYLGNKTKFIKDETWDKIYPLIKSHIPEKNHKQTQNYKTKYPDNLTMNERILFDSFKELPEDIQNKKLIEIVKLAEEEISKRVK